MSGDFEQAKLKVCQSEGAYVTMRPLVSSWEQRKLGELCTISKGHGYSKADIRDAGTPLILYGRLYTQYESRIENVDTFAVEQEGSLLSKGNEVIVPASGETAEDIAVASSVRRSGIIFGGDLNVVTPVSKLDPDYIALAITYSKAHDDLAKRAQGKSVVHVHGNDIAEVEIPYPSESEQKRISTVVLGLDNLITLHQRKYDKLCTVKKSMLDKMFPKPGETEPEIRFEGFTDPWEQRKFSELASLRRGLTYSPTDIRPYGQGVRVLRSSNIAEDEFVLSREDVFVDEDVVKIDLTQDDEILITAANGSPRLVGKRAKIHDLAGKTVHGGFMLCARAEQPDFVVALMGSQWYQRFLVTGVAGGNGSIGNLDKEALENETALIPRTEEQRLIGAYFSRLDALITLHQREPRFADTG